MPRVKQHPVYQWYASFRNKAELHLPDITVEMLGTYRIYCDEVFCRAPGCEKETRETSLNNLRKHYRRKHPDMALTSVSGRPNEEEETMAIAFYKSVRDAWEARQVHARPELPLKDDGTVHLTNARRIVRAAGGQVPCEPCKDANDAVGCVRIESIGRCENFEFFTDDEGESQQDDEEDEDEEDDEDEEMEDFEEMPDEDLEGSDEE